MAAVRPLVVLVPSPLVGAEAMRPLSLVIARAGWTVPVADLGPPERPPYWAEGAARLVASLEPWAGDGGGRLVLVAHSRAGAWLPALAQAVAAAGWTVDAAVFLDAVLPGDPLPAALAAHLDGLADAEGRLPPWTDWWPPAALAEVLPDPELRDRVRAGSPRVPRALLDEEPPVPEGWPDHPVGYLVLTYDDEAAVAGSRGWPVRAAGGGHMAPASRPGGVVGPLLALLGDLRVEGGTVGPPRPPALAPDPEVVDLRDRWT